MSATLAADPAEKLQGYANPERLVTTDWLTEHLDDPRVVVAESDEDVLLCETGHIRGRARSTGIPTSTIRWRATTSTPSGSHD
jgi:3-mercaptopyruvate sulfurtransferase SseA